jgi:hypothetical protein
LHIYDDLSILLRDSAGLIMKSSIHFPIVTQPSLNDGCSTHADKEGISPEAS